MSLGILTSKLQAIKTLKDHEYVQRLKDHDYMQSIQDATKKLTDTISCDQTNVRKTRAQLIRLSAAVCGIELCYAAETAFVSPILLKLGVPVPFMTLVWCVSPLLGLIMVPVMGSLSDRCSLKLGRRRPFILMFSAGIVLGLILVPNGEKFGILAGDSDSETAGFNHSVQSVHVINSTDDLVTFENGTSTISRLNFAPGWPSVRLPQRRIVGILLTVFGVAMLDFNCDACQSPCRTYLLDISVPEDHSRGLTSFTVMAGLGGSFGYLVGGIDWEATSFGAALGGHTRVVFSGVLILFIVCVILTVTSFREMPLKELSGQTVEKLQDKRKTVKKAKYKKFVNESSEEEQEVNENEHVAGTASSYGTLSHQNGLHSTANGTAPPTTTWSDKNANTNDHNSDIDKQNKMERGCDMFKQYSTDLGQLTDEVPLKIYLRSIIKMPRSLQMLCITNLFCWMSLVCYSLYFTDFVGQSVFGGDPRAPPGSYKHRLYDEGVRLGSFGMALYSLSCALYSLAVEYLVNKFSARPVYVSGQLVYTVGMVVLAISRHPAAVILLSPTAGIMYATLFTMPYLLVAHYHSKGQFNDNGEGKECDIRGLGTDVAVVSSMLFLAQFVLSLFMGSLVHVTGSSVTTVIAASILSFCGAICATKVTYLDL